MKKVFLKSSAILIAMIIGMVLMILLVGVSLIISQQSRSAGQSRDGKIAYRAALSGIEDGLERYQFARANQKLPQIFKTFPGNQISSDIRGPKASYDLSISSTLSVGDPTHFTDLTKQVKVPMDDTIDINLSEYSGRINRIDVKFTSPYQVNAGVEQLVPGPSFTAMNIKLVDVAASGEAQLIDEQTNTSSSNHSLSEVKVKNCLSNTECHLRIKPQLVQGIIGSTEAGRIRGGYKTPTVTPIPGGRYVYIAISTDPVKVVDLPNYKPGTIKITSIGIAGQAKRKLEATIDAGSGAYLGLFDWGVYCGEACNWGTKGL